MTVWVMALSPDTIDALSQALDAVIQEAGDDPQYAPLVDHLSAAQHALPGPDHADPAAPGQPKDHQSADAMFSAAEQKHKAARSGGGGNPFGKGAA